MAMYVYNTGGEPVGFVFETTIHNLEGVPIGRILGSRVHRIDGSYVGEWFKDMVVRRPSGRARTIPPIATPQRRDPPGATFKLRAVVDYGYPDVFHLLALRPSNDEGGTLSDAAE